MLLEPKPTLFPAEATGTGDPRAPLHLFVLKHGDIFLVTDGHGDILGNGDGFFRDDTRILSRFRLTIAGVSPSLLSAGVGQDNVLFTSNLTNHPLPPLGGEPVPEGVIHIQRTRLLWDMRLYERLVLTNFAVREAVVPLSLSFEADFRDMFEVRGAQRQNRGRSLASEMTADTVLLQYEGLDGVIRPCSITFSEPPSRLQHNKADFVVELKARGTWEMYVEVGSTGAARPSFGRFRAASAKARFGARATRRQGAAIRTSGRLFNDWIEKSRADLALLTTVLPTGPYPYAGIPWFSTTFGRDAVITAIQMLWLDPSLARGVLAFLGQHQATETSTFHDAAPGKIMHEKRKGEMTALRELPFAQYYGGVDTTPLFVMLAGAYASRTGDMGLIDTLWPALRAAVDWIEQVCDVNPDGFLDYSRGAETGLANQGWKDSHDSVFHADGAQAVGPIALVEVQGYVFAALRAMAELADRRGEAPDATRWRARSEALRATVETRFWLEDIGFYAMALDGEGRPCRVRASNPGHLLFTGLPSAERGARVAAHLLSSDLNSGWGIRTVARGEPNFNPMSYHNGSVWPHDTALCAAGMARYGIRDGVVRLMSGTFEAAVKFGMRLPELFCGFERAAGEAPVAYPVACLPQAWASGAVFMILQACLGLTIDEERGAIHIDRPRLPAGIDHLTLCGVTIRAIKVDVTFQRIGDHVVAYPASDGPSPIAIILHV
jgi:glycogen debranching enzyme